MNGHSTGNAIKTYKKVHVSKYHVHTLFKNVLSINIFYLKSITYDKKW